MALLVEALCCKSMATVSIPDGVFAIFHSLTPSGPSVALGSTHPNTNEYQVHLLGVKTACAYG